MVITLKILSISVIPEFHNAFLHRNNTAEIVSLRPERITVIDKLYHGKVLVLDSSVVRAQARTAGDAQSSPSPG